MKKGYETDTIEG